MVAAHHQEDRGHQRKKGKRPTERKFPQAGVGAHDHAGT